MKNRISKKNSRKSKKSLKKIIGGKPLFRNRNQANNTTLQTLSTTLGLQPGAGGVFNATNVRGLALVTDASLYGYFYRIDLRGNTSIVNINVSNSLTGNPVNTYVEHLGLKICLITDREQGYLGKSTTTVADFRGEAQNQYNIFTASVRNGANALTPGIIHAEIIANIHAISALNNFLSMTQRTGNDPRTVNTFTTLIQVLRQNPTWRMGWLLMEFVPNSIVMSSAITQSGQNDLRKLCLRNWHRWALLRTAHASGIFHRDFHQSNALYSEARASGFHHDMDANGRLVPLDQSIQIIDWGRTFTNPQLFADIRQLFTDMRAYISNVNNANQFTQNITTSRQYAQGNQTIVNLNQRILNIFTRWLALGNVNYPQYTWVISAVIHSQIDSHLIMYYEARYLRNRIAITPTTFASVIQAPDAGITATLNGL